MFSEARLESYRRWSWPEIFARSFKEARATVWLAIVSSLLVATLGFAFIGSKKLSLSHVGPGAFYKVVPYATMVIPAILLTVYGVLVWLYGMNRSWVEMSESKTTISAKAFGKAIASAVGLWHLKGGGPGCAYPSERPSATRRIYHSFVFWGFLSDFVATTLAFVYQDFFKSLPPYPRYSAPVIFGTFGGILLIIGTSGLIHSKWRSDPSPGLKRAYSIDYLFLITLALTAITGLLVLGLRTTRVMGSLLIIHLATVTALFLTVPYSKFVHALYRTLALVRYYVDRGHSLKKEMV